MVSLIASISLFFYIIISVPSVLEWERVTGLTMLTLLLSMAATRLACSAIPVCTLVDNLAIFIIY